MGIQYLVPLEHLVLDSYFRLSNALDCEYLFLCGQETCIDRGVREQEPQRYEY